MKTAIFSFIRVTSKNKLNDNGMKIISYDTLYLYSWPIYVRLVLFEISFIRLNTADVFYAKKNAYKQNDFGK